MFVLKQAGIRALWIGGLLTMLWFCLGCEMSVGAGYSGRIVHPKAQQLEAQTGHHPRKVVHEVLGYSTVPASRPGEVK